MLVDDLRAQVAICLMERNSSLKASDVEDFVESYLDTAVENVRIDDPDDPDAEMSDYIPDDCRGWHDETIDAAIRQGVDFLSDCCVMIDCCNHSRGFPMRDLAQMFFYSRNGYGSGEGFWPEGGGCGHCSGPLQTYCENSGKANLTMNRARFLVWE